MPKSLSKPKVLVTGATGFVGTALLTRLDREEGYGLRAVVRRPAELAATVEQIATGEISARTDWGPALQGVDAVVHLAARVHVMRETAVDPLTEFRRVNVDGTLALARSAAARGVRRFVFLSTVKVNGEGSRFDESSMPYRDSDPPAPRDPYGLSKLEAEAGLRGIAAETGMEVVIIRPPLVYGPGVRANFRSMLRWVNLGLPLPFGAIPNRRSLVALDNLVDLIATCLRDSRAGNQTLLVSDGDDLSTTELLRRIAAALGRPSRLLPVPASLLEATARILGRGDMARRLCGSLQVDISRTRSLLNWDPPARVNDALAQTAAHFLGDLRAR